MPELEKVMNCRKNTTKNYYPIHYRVVGRNSTLCGLHTNKDHAFDIVVGNLYVTCTVCERIEEKWRRKNERTF